MSGEGEAAPTSASEIAAGLPDVSDDDVIACLGFRKSELPPVDEPVAVTDEEFGELMDRLEHPGESASGQMDA